MNEYRKLLETLDTIDEGRIFNNSGELLRSIINDVRNVMTDVASGDDAENIHNTLAGIVEYYKDAELEQSKFNEDSADGVEFMVMPMPGFFGKQIPGWNEMQKYFNGKTQLYVRADSSADGLIISRSPVDNNMTDRAIKQENIW